MNGQDDDAALGWELVRRGGFAGLLFTIVDCGASTRHAHVKGQTMTDVAAILAEAVAGREITVMGDAGHWTMTVYPPTSAAPVDSPREYQA